jgi:hypothetical protein
MLPLPVRQEGQAKAPFSVMFLVRIPVNVRTIINTTESNVYPSNAALAFGI